MERLPEGEVSREAFSATQLALQMKFALMQAAFFMRLETANLSGAAQTLGEATQFFLQYGATLSGQEDQSARHEAVALNYMSGSLFLAMDMLVPCQSHLEAAVEMGPSLAKAEGFDKHLFAALLLTFVHIRRARIDLAAAVLGS